MEIQKFLRRPFEVDVVQVTPQNAAEVAEWCGGTVGTATYKLAGFETPLATVLVPGSGPRKGATEEARIGSYVVRHNGGFRVFRKRHFHETFVGESVLTGLEFKPGELVQETDESEEVNQGEVVYVDQVLVKYPLRGNVLHDPSELVKIEKYSDRIRAAWQLEKEANNGITTVDKINHMRELAEKAVGDGLTLPPLQGSLEEIPSSINGIEVGSVIRVREELNEFFSQCGIVAEILSSTMVLVNMEVDDKPNRLVKHLVREIQLEESTEWVRVSNDISPQFGWVGWVVFTDDVSAKDSENKVVRVAFRPTNYCSYDRCFSYMDTELTPVSLHELGNVVPTYDI